MDSHIQAGKARSVVGVLDENGAVDRLIARLGELGIGPEQVSVMTPEGSGGGPVVETEGARVGGGALSGAAIGGLLGGLAGWMIAIGALAIPGVVVPGAGQVFGVGTLASLLTGIGVGAAAGGLIGALLGLRVPPEEAQQYEQYIEPARTVVTVSVREGQEEGPLVGVLEDGGAHDVRVYEAPSEEPLASLAGRSVHEQAAAVGDAPEASAELPDERPSQDAPVGDSSAHTDALGSGAEGGLGTGEALGPAPSAETDPQLQADRTELQVSDVEPIDEDGAQF